MLNALQPRLTLRPRTSASDVTFPALAALVILGVVGLLVMSWVAVYVWSPHLGQEQDLMGRLANLRALDRSGNIYGSFGGEAFTYPPAAIFLFWPLQWLPADSVAYVWSLLSLSALAGVFYQVLRYRFSWRAPQAAAGACWAAILSAMLFAPISQNLGWGQVGTILLLLVAVDFFAPRLSSRGVLTGLATAFKIYPGIFIIGMMFRREWRSAATSLVTAVSATAAAWLVWPASVSTYFKEMVLGGKELAHFAGPTSKAGSSSILAFFQRPPFHGAVLSSSLKLALMVLVISVSLVAAHRLWTRDRRLSAFLILMIGSCIGAPIAWSHYFVFAPLLLFVPFELGGRSALARTSAVAALVMSVPWFDDRIYVPGGWVSSLVAFGTHNAILFASLAMLGAALLGDREHVEVPTPVAG